MEAERQQQDHPARQRYLKNCGYFSPKLTEENFVTFNRALVTVGEEIETFQDTERI